MTPNAAGTQHDELRDLLGAYALDALSREERAALRAHLATCPECQAELAELRAVVAELPVVLDELEPSAALRERLEAEVRADAAASARAARAASDWSTPLPAMSAPPAPAAPIPPQYVAPSRQPEAAPTPISAAPSRRRVVPWAAVAALFLLVSVGMLLWNLRLQQGTGELGGAVVALVPEAAAPEVEGEVHLDTAEDLVVLDVDGLPALDPGEVYQVWLIGEDGAPVPSGVFAATRARHAIAVDPSAYQTLAITNEPGPLGSPGPTGEIVATAPLGG